MDEKPLAYIDPAFEFDAPRFYDFQTMEPGSPSETDLWFDTTGPKGLASPKAGCQGSGAIEATKPVAALQAGDGAMRAHTTGGELCPAKAEVVVKGAGAGVVSVPVLHRAPSNLVTSWAGAPAIRVPARSSESTAGEHQTTEAGCVAAPQKRVGFITPRQARPPRPPAVKAPDETSPVQEKKTETSAVAKQKGQEARNTMPKRAAKSPAERQNADNKPSKRLKPSIPLHPNVAFVQGENPWTAGVCAQKLRASKAWEMAALQAPTLVTSTRARPQRFKTREEEEEEEMAAMPRFKARPISASLTRGTLRAEHRLSSASLVSRHSACRSDQEQEKPPKFKARPLNPRLLQGPTFVPQRPQHEPVLPHAPSLATDARSRCQKPEQGATPFVFKAPADPFRRQTRAMKRQQQPQQQGGPTEPKPFTLATDLRGQAAQAAQQEAFRKAEEEAHKAREIRAQPLPPTTHHASPAFKYPDPVFTMPEPFHLESEKRHEEARILQELLNQQAAERERQQSHFKAQPMPKGRAFVPARSDRLLTVPEAFQLPGDTRSRQRAEFDASMQEKERKLQEEKAAAEQEQRRREEAEIKELRKNLQFKARPMPEYRSEVTHLQLPPPQWTEPVSPKLATGARAAARTRQGYL